MKMVVVLVLVALVTSLIAGCAPISVPEAQQDVQSAESVLCASIQVYKASVEALQGVTAETTVAELEALTQAEAQAYEAMVAAWADLQEAEVQTVESAVAEFQSSLRDVSAEDTLGEVATGIQTSAATVRAAVDQLGQTACAPAQ
jgi:hypothetical protein